MALARQGELVLAGDGTPLDREEGSLVVYQSGRWSPVCTSSFSSTLMHQLCRYMGWPRGLYKSLVGKSATGLQVIEEDGAVFGKARSSDQECSHVSLACDPAVCGVRTLYGGLEEDQVQASALIVLIVVTVLIVLSSRWFPTRQQQPGHGKQTSSWMTSRFVEAPWSTQATCSRRSPAPWR